MKILAFSLTLIGIFILIIMLNLTSPLIIDSPFSLSKLVDNSKVQITGKVISERTLYEQTKLLKLNNNIEVICQACPEYVNRTLTIMGTSETYVNRTQVNALKITSP